MKNMVYSFYQLIQCDVKRIWLNVIARMRLHLLAPTSIFTRQAGRTGAGALFIFVMPFLFYANVACAAAANVTMQQVKIDLYDKPSLQRGAKIFMNYCSGCHSLRYLRYSQMAKGLGLTTFDGHIDRELLENNLIFTGATPHDPVVISMPDESARQWFGRIPPDLSLSAREKGAEWIYTYLKSFYQDEKRPFGANNLLVPDVSMPNVLEGLQGKIIAFNPASGKAHGEVTDLVLVEKGSMSQQQFDQTIRDLVTFLAYVAEPHRLSRYHLGIVVLGFLIILAVFAYLLKQNYWRDVH